MDAIYNTIGSGYNSTRRADPYITSRLLHFLAPHPGKIYLDIGCGTGNYTGALAEKGLNFTGVEPSEAMLEIAQSRYSKVLWQLGTAEQIPADDNSFDGIIATLTIHHWADIERAFREIYRIAKTGAKIVIFTATPYQMEGYWLNYYFPEMLRAAIKQMPSFKTINLALENAGFEIVVTDKYFIQDDLQDNFLYTGKIKPELYLDEKIRMGISSFAALANEQEVKDGLKLLRADLGNGNFLSVKNRYGNDSGDYLFIIAEKR